LNYGKLENVFILTLPKATCKHGHHMQLLFLIG
jgi:hypothetical protein